MFKTQFLNSGASHRRKPSEKKNVGTNKVAVADYRTDENGYNSDERTKELENLEMGIVTSYSYQSSPETSPKHSHSCLSPPGILIKQEKFDLQDQTESVFRLSPTLKLKQSKAFRQEQETKYNFFNSTGSTASTSSSSGYTVGGTSNSGELDELEVLELGNSNTFAFEISQGGKIKEWNSKTNKFVDLEADGSKFNPPDKGKELSKKKRDDDVYVGDMNEAGKKHGRGRLVYENGDVYYGDWVDNRRHGMGTFIYANGNKYSGMFERGKKSGIGDFTFVSLGDSYSGGFVADVIEGKGMYQCKDGSTYEGHFVNGLKEGKGTQTYASKAQYKGNWKADKPSGKGKYTFSSGKVFKGRFKNGEMDGSGMMKLPNSNQIFIAVFDEGALLSIEPMKFGKDQEGEDMPNTARSAS